MIGAGPAGLAAASALHRRGEPLTLLEAAPRAGGWCQTERVAGYAFETGPQTWRAPAGEGSARGMDELVAWAGLRAELRPPSPAASRRFLLRHGRLRSLPRGLPALLGPGGCLRALSERLRAPQPRPRESVAAFARRRFGPATAPLVDAFVSGVFAGDAERLELASAFPVLARAERDYGSVLAAARAGGFPRREVWGLSGGLGSLSEALAEDLGPLLRCGARVSGLLPARAGQPWEVYLSSGESFSAERLLLALPAWAAAPLLAPHDPLLGSLLRGIPYAPVAVVSLGFAREAFRRGPPEGFGFLAPRCEGKRILGCIYASSVFPESAPPGKVGLRVLLGGLQDPGAVELSEAQLLETTLRELSPLLGIEARPEQVLVQRLQRAIPQYLPGHAERVAAIEARAATWPGLELIGNAYRGVSISDAVSDALRAARA